MSKKPVIINQKCLISEALKTMNEKKITVLLVESKKKLIGLIHMHNILKFLNS